MPKGKPKPSEATGSRHVFYVSFDAMKHLRKMAKREGVSMSSIVTRLIMDAK